MVHVRCLYTITLLLLSLVSIAQTKITSIALQVNTGVGISNKPGTVFGAPFSLSGDLAVTFNERWQIAAEGGGVRFRDSKHPYDKIGLIVSGYSRYDHQYVGLRVGRNSLSSARPQQLFFSSGVDYLLVIEPNVKTSSGFFSGKSFDYQYKRFLNVPIQVEYSTPVFKGKQTRVSFTGRWNFNAYHSFPMISVGVGIPVLGFLFD